VLRQESEGEVTQGEKECFDRNDRVLSIIGLLCGGLMDNWWVYIIEKKTGLYVGITTDLENRMRQHGQPAPLYYEGPISKSDALKRERTLKGLNRIKKLDLIAKASKQQK
jgi:predicted GIY-YIG superfamily endonuclease